MPWERERAVRASAMTLAVCIACGAKKFGAFAPCPECRLEPDSEIEAAYSLALTDHYFASAVLDEISASIRSGRPRPSLPADQEEQLREAVRPFLNVKRRRERRRAGQEPGSDGT